MSENKNIEKRLYSQTVDARNEENTYTFRPPSAAPLIFDTIVQMFLASKEMELEIVHVPEGTLVDGYPVRQFNYTPRELSMLLHKSINNMGLRGEIKTRSTQKDGGHVWLQKRGVEKHYKTLESEKIAPYWSKKSNRDKEKKRQRQRLRKKRKDRNNV